MMAGYHAAGMAGQQRDIRAVRAKMPRGPRLPGLRRARASDRRLAQAGISPEQIEAIRHWPAFQHIDRSGDGQAGRHAFEGTSGRCPRERSSSRVRRCSACDGLFAAGSMGGNAAAGVAGLPDPGGLESGADRRRGRRTVALRVRARRGHGPLAGLLAARQRPNRRLRRDQPRRGRAPPAASRRSVPWPTRGSSRSRRSRRRSRRSRASSPDNTTLLVDTYDTLEGVRLAAAIEPPVQAIRIDSGDLGTPGAAGTSNPRSARPLDGEDRRLRRSRRAPNRSARRCGCADRRLRGRNRADHVARRAGPGHGLQARRARRRREVQAQPRQEDVPDGEAGLPAPRPHRPILRRPRHAGPTRRPKGSRCWCRSFNQAGWWMRCLRSRASATTAEHQLAALPERLLAWMQSLTIRSLIARRSKTDARRLFPRVNERGD